MKISDFWNQAFISCLGRLPADEARAEADKALAIAFEHWQEVMKDKGQVVHATVPYASLDVADVRHPAGAR